MSPVPHTLTASIVDDTFGIPEVQISIGSEISRTITKLSPADLGGIIAALTDLLADHSISTKAVLTGQLVDSETRWRISQKDSEVSS
jgi:hypothetical protein